jgi:hypothetical protein
MTGFSYNFLVVGNTPCNYAIDLEIQRGQGLGSGLMVSLQGLYGRVSSER